MRRPLPCWCGVSAREGSHWRAAASSLRRLSRSVSCRGRSLRRRSRFQPGSASMLHNTLQTNATQMAPESRSLSIALFAICFFLGQAVGVSLGAPVFDYAGGAPLFLTSGLILMVLAFAFRLALGRR